MWRHNKLIFVETEVDSDFMSAHVSGRLPHKAGFHAAIFHLLAQNQMLFSRIIL
jgi:hypothetical protein